MKEIEISERMNVTFKNVVSVRFDSFDIKKVEESATKFDSYIKEQGLNPYGPLIIVEGSENKGDDVQFASEIMIQLKDKPEKIPKIFTFKEQVRMENCIMSRYVGPVNQMFLAHSKILIYAFENDIELSNISCTVISDTEDGLVSVDAFRPLA